jgi:Ca-activated chloride channel homolog
MIWDSPLFFLVTAAYTCIVRSEPFLFMHVIRNRRKRYFSDAVFADCSHTATHSAVRFREGLFYAGLFFLIIALAGPQIGTEVREIQREQLDLIVALDLSKSMKAEDVRPSRLEKAKFEISRVLDNLENDRIGLIVFTGHAMLICPLTTDYSAFRMFLDIADTDIMPSSTTDFQPLFREAVSAFESSERARGNPARVLVIFSDGEDHFDRFSEPLRQLLDMGVYIFTVGIGTEGGGRIPRVNPETGGFQDFHRDRQGRVVTSRLEPDRLREMADPLRRTVFPDLTDRPQY